MRMILVVMVLAGCAPIPRPDTAQLPPVWPAAPPSTKPSPVEKPAPPAPSPEPSQKTPVPPLKPDVLPPSTPPRT